MPEAAQPNACGHHEPVRHPGMAYDLGRRRVDPAETTYLQPLPQQHAFPWGNFFLSVNPLEFQRAV
jgi:hypothetical protein